MLFRKKVESACVYCLHATVLDGESAICRKHGVVDLWGKCASFKYDPLKREPENDAGGISSDFDESDFEI
ncbi:MAG: hypothetical protein K6F67_06495 [Oscillospiraceae bacterium]|nr:hypothetical protein [Oscillospiraceae bacterium]